MSFSQKLLSVLMCSVCVVSVFVYVLYSMVCYHHFKCEQKKKWHESSVGCNSTTNFGKWQYPYKDTNSN